MNLPLTNRNPIQHRLRAAVFGPARDVVAGRNRAFLAVGERAHARRLHAILGEIVFHARRAPRTQRNIVFARAAFVGMAFNRDRVLRILLQPLRLLGQGLLRFGRQIRAIRREVDDVADGGGKVLGAAGCAARVGPFAAVAPVLAAVAIRGAEPAFGESGVFLGASAEQR